MFDIVWPGEAMEKVELGGVDELRIENDRITSKGLFLCREINP